MINQPQRGFFITGTDTEVGKTYVTSLLARRLRGAGIRSGVYKPVASGCRTEHGELVSDDALQLWEAAGRSLTVSQVCPQQFQAPLAPHLAARAEGKRVDAGLLRTGIAVWSDQCDVMLVEGAGGLLSPISDQDLVADLATDLGYPLLVVAPNVLGVINQTLQTLIAAQHYGLKVGGVILNELDPTRDDPSTASNYAEISRLAPVPVLGHVPYGDGEVGKGKDEADFLARLFEYVLSGLD